MERAAFQASEWTRNVVGRANIAVSSSNDNNVHQEEFSDENISDKIASHPTNSKHMSREEVNMAIRASNLLQFDMKQCFANRGTGANRRAKVMRPVTSRQQQRQRGLDQCMHVSEIV